jgi:MerR family mercuric resistance operon transcriptional regulator
LKRGDVARMTGCNLETIRYYEKIGLLLEPPRNAASYRIYDDSHVRRLRFILRGRELGFSIEDIRGLLDLVDGGTQTCSEVKIVTEHHLSDVRTKIADLRRIEVFLAQTAAKCSGAEVPECPVLEALDP